MRSTGKRRVNLTLEPGTVDRARRYSLQHGTSISELVEGYLSSLPDSGDLDLAPTVAALLGLGKGEAEDRADYRSHLEDK